MRFTRFRTNWSSSVEVRDEHHCATCQARQLTLCSGVNSEQLPLLESHSQVFDVRRGVNLFMQGDRAAYVYNVIQGCLRLSNEFPDGRRQVLGFPKPGDCFGITHLAVYDYGANALTNCRVCRIPATAFRSLLLALPPVNHALHRREEELLHEARTHAMALGRGTALERVAGFLLECLDHRATGKDMEVILSMHRGDIGDYLGLTLETVSRTFTILRRRALIQLHPHGVVKIVDRPVLERIANPSNVGGMKSLRGGSLTSSQSTGGSGWRSSVRCAKPIPNTDSCWVAGTGKSVHLPGSC